MRRRSRTRRVLKWIGTATTFVIVLAALINVWFNWGFAFARGSISFLCGNVHVVGRKWEHLAYRDHRFGFESEVNQSGFRFSLPVLLEGGASSATAWGWRNWSAIIPLWVVLIVAAAPTAILWYPGRRIPPGHCQHCGYDLTGNVSGRCPECGTAVPAKQAK